MLAPFKAEIRRLRKSATTTSAVLLCMALGIGATTAVFTVVDAAVLHPLPYSESERLVTIGERTDKRVTRFAVSIPNYRDWQAQATAFSSLGAYSEFLATLTSAEGPQRVFGGKASPEFFDALRVRPTLGRLLRREDPADSVAILSDGFWGSKFGRDPGALGRVLEVDGTLVTVVGVLDRSFRTPGQEPIDVWLPLGFHDSNYDRRDARTVTVVGRLRSAVTVEEAQSELGVIGSGLAVQYAATNAGSQVIVRRLSDQVVGQNGPPFLMLFGAVLLVLLMASLNVAGLLLARDIPRQRELALRTAVGASWSDLVWQIATETAILLIIGTGLGLLCAHWSLELLVAFAPPYMHTLANARMNGFIVAISIGLALVSGCTVAGFQLFQLSRMNVVQALRELPAGSVRRLRTRRLIVVAELTLALTLAADAAVVLRQLADVWPSRPGFEPKRTITVRFVLNPVRFPDGPSRRTFYRSVVDGLAQNPSIEGAAVASILPLDRFFMAATVAVDTKRDSAPLQLPNVQYRAVSPNFFDVLKIPIRSGRAFTITDDERSPVAVIVNETLRLRLGVGDGVLGQPVSITVLSTTGSLRGDLTRVGTIVGVAGDTQEMSNPTAIAYVPFLQHPMPVLSIVLRSHDDPANLVKKLRDDFKNIDATQAPDIGSYDDIVNWIVALPRFYALLIGTFAMITVILVVAGLAGLLASVVAQRRAEIGIRRVVGATEGDTIKLILKEGAVLCMVGVALGTVGAVASIRAIKAVVPVTRSYDLPGFLAAVAAVTTVVLSASYVAARRAARVDPSAILRAE